MISRGDGGVTRVDPTNSNTVYMEFANLGSLNLLVSFDGGATRQFIRSGIAYCTSGANPIVNFEAPYVLDSAGNIY
jgi:hypothetical protein